MFNIPGTPLEMFTTGAVEKLRADAHTEFAALLKTATSTGDPSEEQLARLEALQAFVASADSHLEALTAAAATVDDTDTAGDAPRVADIAATDAGKATTATATATVARGGALVAAAGIDGYVAGQTMPDLAAVGDAINRHAIGFAGMDSGQSSTAIATFAVNRGVGVTGDSRTEHRAAVEEAVSEQRFGGDLAAAKAAAVKAGASLDSLTAAAGWCAPSEVDYTINFYGSAAGSYDAPTVNAPRGGLWVMPELTYANVIGTAPGPFAHYFNLTELQVIAGTPKTFVEIDCPTPTEYRLGVTGFGAVANLLALRAYPEYTQEYVRAALVGLGRYRSALEIAAVAGGSTAVNLTAQFPWSSDNSVISKVLPAAEMAAVDQRYRAALPPNATVEQIYPLWLLAQFRADWVRRSGQGDIRMADAWIMGEFASRNIAPQFVEGYQDAYTLGAGYPGHATPVTQLPTTLKFLSYPAGTWVRAELDVITIRSVFDSVRLASNQKIEIFTETGWRMVQRRADSREYELTICPTGLTSGTQTVACASQN